MVVPAERVIGEEGLRATPDGLRLAMRLPWYRSLPFSTVEVASVVIDGQPVDLIDARVECDDNTWSLAELGEATNAFWFIRDSAFLVMPNVQAEPGSEHTVTLTLHVAPPYIPGMKRINPETATLTVA